MMALKLHCCHVAAYLQYAATWQQCSFYKYFKHFKNWITATQRGNKWEYPWWYLQYAATWQQCSFYKYFKHFKNWITATQRENNEEIPDDGLKGSKHDGLFIKSVLSDFNVT